MSTPLYNRLKSGALTEEEKALIVKRRNQDRLTFDPQRLVEIIRAQTPAAVGRLVDLMDGKGTKAKIMNRDGDVVEVEVPVPPAVQLRAAEILLERGWGKTPQAMLIHSTDKPSTGVHALPIMDRIKAIMAAREAEGETTDLEASEIQEVPPPVNITPSNPHDLV